MQTFIRNRLVKIHYISLIVNSLIGKESNKISNRQAYNVTYVTKSLLSLS